MQPGTIAVQVNIGDDRLYEMFVRGSPAIAANGMCWLARERFAKPVSNSGLVATSRCAQEQANQWLSRIRVTVERHLRN